MVPDNSYILSVTVVVLLFLKINFVFVFYKDSKGKRGICCTQRLSY